MIAMHAPSAAQRPDVPLPPVRLTVGIGEYAIAHRPEQTIVTHALGSCIAVCVFDPVAGVAGMLHFLLPEAAVNPERACVQPGAFADTGVPALLDLATQAGLDKRRAVVTLVGGAESGDGASASLQIGRRNVLAAKHFVWRNGVLVKRQDVGGSLVRTVHLAARDGSVKIYSELELVKEL